MSFTRKQARAILEWGKRQKEYVEAYTNPLHPEHARLQLYVTRLLEIANAPGGGDDANEPIFDVETFIARAEAAPEGVARRRLESIIAGDRAPAPLDAPLPEDDGLAELRGLSPEAAQERIKALMNHPEWGDILYREKDPFAHAAWDFLHALAYPEPTAEGAGAPVNALPNGSAAAAPARAQERGASPSSQAAQARARLAELNAAIQADRNHPFWNPSHPQHRAVEEERSALYAAAYAPEPGASETGVG